MHLSRTLSLLLLSLLFTDMQAQITWSSNVAQIVYNKCTPCHRSGEIAPFNLESYSDAATYAYSSRAMVEVEAMPPWPPAKGHGDFLGDRSLNAAEKQMLIDWVEGGMKRGDPTQEPPPPNFPSGSQLGTPDLVLEMSEEWNIPANSADEYRFFVLPSGLLEDKNLAAIEFRPGNANVVHHVLFYADTTGRARELDAQDPLPGYSGFGEPGFESAGSYLGWVPGAQMRFFPEGIGMHMYKGSDIVIQIHYAPSYQATTDRSHLNIFFQKNDDVRVIQQFTMSPYNLVSGNFLIPANTVKKFTTRYTIPLDISLVAVAPHMHLLGQNCRAYAVTPAGDTINLIKINIWDFQWQGSYTYRHPVRIPRNSILTYEAEYDNTSDNPYNPNNPPKLVGWGEGTAEEMLLSYFFWLPYQFGDESLVMDTPTSLKLEALSFRHTIVSVVPSPVTDYADVRINAETEGDATVEVYDIIGHLVLQEALSFKLQALSFRLNTSNLSNGLYNVVVNSAEGRVTTPMVVVR